MPVSSQALRRMRQIEALQPRTAEQLHRFVRVMLGLSVPRRPLVEGNQAPFDYLQAAFFESGAQGVRDIVVWANRGGGKTQLGAAATLLDMLYKPGIQVRILGGSMEQSSRMYDYLLRVVKRPAFSGALAGEPTQRRIELVNGSAVELLAQSQTSVRGTRVHKLRCDEVEEFDPAIWQAAQLVTRSGLCGSTLVRGTIEAISTMHHPFGLMSRLVEGAALEGGAAPRHAAALNGGAARLFRWCAMDVIERCPARRDCQTCVLWGDCGGRAKEAEGFVSVDDLVTQRRRSSDTAWESEMMCRRPTRTFCVYPQFNPQKHVAPTGPGGGRSTLAAGPRSESPYSMDATAVPRRPRGDEEKFQFVAGMDFGVRSPLVMLWARVSETEADPRERMLEVFDEYVEPDLVLEHHLERIAARGWPKPEWIGVDPAGGQRNSHTGLTDIQVLKRHGYKVRSQRATLAMGIEAIRRRFDRGLLRIDPSCRAVIRALGEYHFDEKNSRNDRPIKDGPDHVCDALRYLVLNLEFGAAPLKQGAWV